MSRDTGIVPNILPYRQISVQEMEKDRGLLQRILLALGNSDSMIHSGYIGVSPTIQPLPVQIEQLEYAPYKFFKNEGYEVKFIDIQNQLIKVIIYNPTSPKELEEQIDTDVCRLMEQGKFSQ